MQPDALLIWYMPFSVNVKSLINDEKDQLMWSMKNTNNIKYTKDKNPLDDTKTFSFTLKDNSAIV